MIAYIEGIILLKLSRYIIVVSNGLGYKIFLSLETLRNITEKGSHIKLFIHHAVRETSSDLYGFINLSELEFFESLITISGIGPKTALGILNMASVDALRRAIGSGEVGHLTKVSGIGRKTAEKIVVELRDKLSGGADEGAHFKEEADAIDALSSLGYSQTQAREALRKVPEKVNGIEQKISKALKILGGGENK